MFAPNDKVFVRYSKALNSAHKDRQFGVYHAANNPLRPSLVSALLPRCLAELLAQFWPSIKVKIMFEFRLTARTAEEEPVAFVFDHYMCLATIHAFTAYSVFEHKIVV